MRATSRDLLEGYSGWNRSLQHCYRNIRVDASAITELTIAVLSLTVSLVVRAQGAGVKATSCDLSKV